MQWCSEVVHEAQAINVYVIFVCMQWIAENIESLKDPSLSEEKRDQLKRNVKGWKGYIQKYQELIVSINSALEEKNSGLQGIIKSCMLSS